MRKSKFVNNAKVIEWKDRPAGMPWGGLRLKELDNKTDIYLYEIGNFYEGYAVKDGNAYDVLNNNGTLLSLTENEYFNSIDC